MKGDLAKQYTINGVLSSYVRRTRFELVKAEPADLQSAPFDRFGTDALFVVE